MRAATSIERRVLRRRLDQTRQAVDHARMSTTDASSSQIGLGRSAVRGGSAVPGRRLASRLRAKLALPLSIAVLVGLPLVLPTADPMVRPCAASTVVSHGRVAGVSGAGLSCPRGIRPAR
jgi:hypothetical protein